MTTYRLFHRDGTELADLQVLRPLPRDCAGALAVPDCPRNHVFTFDGKRWRDCGRMPEGEDSRFIVLAALLDQIAAEYGAWIAEVAGDPITPPSDMPEHIGDAVILHEELEPLVRRFRKALTLKWDVARDHIEKRLPVMFADCRDLAHDAKAPTLAAQLARIEAAWRTRMSKDGWPNLSKMESALGAIRAHLDGGALDIWECRMNDAERMGWAELVIDGDAPEAVAARIKESL